MGGDAIRSLVSMIDKTVEAIRRNRQQARSVE
jgi:hypothetical protein